MPTQPTYSCQKQFFTQKGTFDRMRNPTAGLGRVLPTSMVEEILNLNGKKQKNALPSATPTSKVKNPATASGWVILHRCKTWNEELLVRLMDPRPASEFAHYPLCLFQEIVDTPYTTDNSIQLEAPVSFTFYLGFNKDAEKDVIFSVKCPVKGIAGKSINLYFSNSFIPDEGQKVTDIVGCSIPKTTIPSTTKLRTRSIVPSCSDENKCRGIAAAHSIRQDVFQQCLNNFWKDRPVPPATVITWAVLEQVLSEHSPETEQVRLLWVDDDFRNNNVDFGFESNENTSQNAGNSQTDVKTDYSIELFYGIQLLSSSSTIELRLYKGQNNDGTKTILIESVGNGLGYYDISSDRP